MFDGGGTGGDSVFDGYTAGEHLPGTPDSLQAQGWECTNWWSFSCHDDGTSVGLKKTDGVNLYRAHCSKTLAGWYCQVDTIEKL